MARSLAGCAAVLLVGVVLAPSVHAQRTTGSIVGTVTDDTGAILPGVTVAIKGPTIVGTQTALTSDKGRYIFQALPPGSYDITFTLSGFSTLNRQGVRVGVGATQEVNVALKLSQLAEEVTIVGESPVVDTTSNQVSTNYDKDWVRNAPIRRYTFFDLINAAPGVTQSTAGGFSNATSSSFGSGTDENSYQLDGTDFTAPLTGEAWPYPNTDAIEEIEILSLGAPAEYGSLQGAVFNVVTRQGGNEFHGDANFYFQDQGLTSRNTSDEQDGGLPYNRDKFNDLTFQLGGPIVKDKLWFFASYQYQRDWRSQPGVEAQYPVKENADRVFGKLNWQINSKNKVMFSYHDDYYDLPFQQTAFTAPSSIQVEYGNNPSPGVTFTSVLSDKTYLELRYSGFYGNDHAKPLNECATPSFECGPQVNPRFYNLDTSEITGGIYYWYTGEVWKSAANAKLSHFADDFLGGSHDFKFGVQFNSGGSDYATGPNDYIYTYSYTDAYGYSYQVGYGYSIVPYHYGGTMRSVGVYADDTFRVNDRLTLNLGLRYDNSRASIQSFPILDRDGNPTGEQSQAIDGLYTWNTVSPRIGFNYKLTGDGKTVLRAHYGRYYRGIVTGEFSAVGPSIPPLFSGSYNFESGQLEDLQLVQDNTNLQVDGGYKNPYTDQYIVSLDRELVNHLGLSLHYVHKRGRNYGAWQETRGEYADETLEDPETGRPITVKRLVSEPSERLFLLTNPGEMRTNINAFTVQLNKRMADHWQLTTSLVYSKAEGRLASSNQDLEAPQRGSVRGDFGQNPNDFINTDGLLVQDRPWVFKTQLVVELPAGFLVSANYMNMSGRPWSRTLREELGFGVPTEILAEPIDGSRRVPRWNMLDVRLQKEFGLSDRVRVGLFADILNTFNNDANESVASRETGSDGFDQPTLFLDPRRVMLGAKLRF
jgi:outer membrane receptor protein involved in Fe transport